jgi:hypothetical protein
MLSCERSSVVSVLRIGLRITSILHLYRLRGLQGKNGFEELEGLLRKTFDHHYMYIPSCIYFESLSQIFASFAFFAVNAAPYLQSLRQPTLKPQHSNTAPIKARPSDCPAFRPPPPAPSCKYKLFTNFKL